MALLLILLTETDSGGPLRNIENDVLALQEDVTEDREANTLIRLNATKAGDAAVVHGREVDVAPRHYHSRVSTHSSQANMPCVAERIESR